MAGTAKSYYRRRVVIENVGTAAAVAEIPLLDPPGEIRNVFATIDPTRDPEASPGTTGATDIAVYIQETAAPTSRILYAAELNSTAPCTFVESLRLDRPFLRTSLFARVFANPGGAQDATMVLEVEFAE